MYTEQQIRGLRRDCSKQPTVRDNHYLATAHSVSREGRAQ